LQRRVGALVGETEGVQFRSDSLAGKRTLLKVFRGGW